MIVASDSLRIVVPRAQRIMRWERLRIPWRLPDWPATTLPVAVSLKRFFAPDLVFIFGISVSINMGVNPLNLQRPGSHVRPAPTFPT